MAAYGLGGSNSWLGGFFRRKKSQKGPTVAITATAHKLAVIIYNMLKYKTPYKDLGAGYFEEKYRNRTIKNLKQKAKAFGFEICPINA